MKRFSLISYFLFGSSFFFAGLSLTANEETFNSFLKKAEPILDNYCYDCHGLGVSEGDVTLDEFNPETISDTDLWLRVLKNSRAHIMPPHEEAQPTEEERNILADWIKSGPFGIDSKNPDPGRMTVQRLNRIEYQNTINDLFGIEFNTLDIFPADDSGEGFDNIGDVLTISPMLLEKYLDAANAIVAKAVPIQSLVMPERKWTKKSLVNLFSPAPPIDKDEENLQLSFYEPSTRTANFQLEVAGNYQFVVRIKPKSFSSFNGFDYNECRFTFQADGNTLINQTFAYTSGKIHEFVFDTNWGVGTHSLSASVEPLTDLEKVKKLKMEIEEIIIRGPDSPKHWSAPDNYEAYFPEGIPAGKSKRKSYTHQLLSRFATKAYRRPVDNTTINKLVSLAESISAQKGKTYEEGIAQAMVAILASPRFIFREEDLNKKSRDETHAFIDEYALASRLSYFLWSTMPDDELFELAEQGNLRENLESQIERMMTDKRFDRFIENFGGQWLHSRDIQGVNISDYDVWLRDNPNPVLREARAEYQIVREIPEFTRTPEQQETYRRTRELVTASYDLERPDWSGPLRRAMQLETEEYFKYIIKEDRNVLELLDSDYTFLNELLAKHYGIEGVEGSKTRKVQLASDSPRGGILTQGTILAFTSNPTRTSPVKRGVFILENILGTPPAPPPPDIPALEDVASKEKISAMSLREILALHREEPLCSSCHNRMDPLGLALENFNAMGMWRDQELEIPIDSEGILITGERFSSIQEMKHILANDRKRDFYYCMSEKLLTYALGRGTEYYDTITIDYLVNELEKNDGRPSALLMAVIKSVPFQKRRHPDFSPN
ncbi:MAG: DUF1592 domain-containing protein [Verrucomicrobia bacterium]|nr:DUF1592 domain-containing protein [Verrucomicrobiota bacterium]